MGVIRDLAFLEKLLLLIMRSGRSIQAKSPGDNTIVSLGQLSRKQNL